MNESAVSIEWAKEGVWGEALYDLDPRQPSNRWWADPESLRSEIARQVGHPRESIDLGPVVMDHHGDDELTPPITIRASFGINAPRHSEAK